MAPEPDVLTRRLQDLADAEPATADRTDPVERVRHRMDRRRRARRAGAGGAVALVVVAGAALGAAVVADDGAETEVVTETAAPATEPPPAPTPPGRTPGVTTLDPGPLSLRLGVAVVATDDAIVVWGGDLEGQTHLDGASHDLATATWSAIPPAPLPVPDRETWSVGVWTGEHVIVFRGAHVAAWDPAEGTWERRADTAQPVYDAFWTGTAVLTADGRYDPVADAWTPLPEAPVDLRETNRRASAWTGSELVVVPAPPLGARQIRAAAYDPATDRWRELPPVDLGHDEQALDAVWTGTEVAVVGYAMSSVAYDPVGDSWRRLPDLPVRFFEDVPTLAVADGYLVAFRRPGIGVLGSDGWTVVPFETDLSTLPPTATADGALYGFGLTIGEGEDNRFSAFDPEDALASQTRLLGLTALDLAADERATAQRLEREPAAEWITSLHLEVDTPDGGCTLAQAPNGDDFTEEMSEPNVEGDGVVVEVRATRTRIDCADPALGLDLAARLRPAPELR